MTDLFYKYHVFFCVNQRQGGKTCCANAGSVVMRDYAKGRIKALGMADKGEVRINQAGCLNRCGEGPVVVVYPEGVWYSYVDKDDIDEIIDEHLCHGRVVKRLLI